VVVVVVVEPEYVVVVVVVRACLAGGMVRIVSTMNRARSYCLIDAGPYSASCRSWSPSATRASSGTPPTTGALPASCLPLNRSVHAGR
jgi:hypothetical protein